MQAPRADNFPDRFRGKRLQALLPLLLESLERHGHLVLDLEIREKLLTISSATIDRLLAPVRKTSPGNGWRRPPRARSAVQRRMPVRTFNGWGEVKEAGWLEIDLVAHCGKWMEGRFLSTLVATDMATGWSDCPPLLNRDGASVMAALLEKVRRCQASLASLSAGQENQEQRPRTGTVDPEQATRSSAHSTGF